jgi:hypothetical protein
MFMAGRDTTVFGGQKKKCLVMRVGPTNAEKDRRCYEVTSWLRPLVL